MFLKGQRSYIRLLESKNAKLYEWRAKVPLQIRNMYYVHFWVAVLRSFDFMVCPLPIACCQPHERKRMGPEN